MVWHVRSSAERFRTVERQDWVSAIAFSPDGDTVASASLSGDDRRIRLWSLKSGGLRGEFPEQGKIAVSLAFAPSGTRLLSGHEDGTIRVWDVATRHPLVAFPAAGTPIRCLQFTRDGNQVLAVSQEDIVVLDGAPAVDTEPARGARQSRQEKR